MEKSISNLLPSKLKEAMYSRSEGILSSPAFSFYPIFHFSLALLCLFKDGSMGSITAMEAGRAIVPIQFESVENSICNSAREWKDRVAAICR